MLVEGTGPAEHAGRVLLDADATLLEDVVDSRRREVDVALGAADGEARPVGLHEVDTEADFTIPAVERTLGPRFRLEPEAGADLFSADALALAEHESRRLFPMEREETHHRLRGRREVAVEGRHALTILELVAGGCGLRVAVARSLRNGEPSERRESSHRDGDGQAKCHNLLVHVNAPP